MRQGDRAERTHEAHGPDPTAAEPTGWKGTLQINGAVVGAPVSSGTKGGAEGCRVLASVRENKLEGNVRELAVLDGIVHLGEGSELLPGVYVEGVAMIGKNCKIGPNCYLRGLNYIGSNCHIGQAVEVKNSILMSNVKAGHLSYIGDSIICSDVNIGAGTITSNLRHDGKKQRSVVNGTLVDTGRRKLGAIIGKDVHTGIHTSIYPGRKIWSGMDTRPGDIIQQDLRNAPEGD